MSRILLAAYSNVTWTNTKYHDGFTEGFARALKRSGNEVLIFHLNGLLAEQFSNKPKDKFDGMLIKETIANFDPELIITFNNSMPCEDIAEVTDCPIAIYSADTPALYADKERIKKYIDRYYFLNGSRIIAGDVEERFSPNSERMIFFGHATDMRAADLEQVSNITYIGSMPNHSYAFINFFEQLNLGEPDDNKKNEVKNAFFKALDDIGQHEFTSDFDFDFSKYYSSEMENFAEFSALCLYSCKNKFEILSHLTDLGLKIHGFPWSWPYAMQFNFDLFRHFDYRLSVSMEQNSINFNSSKISLNMPNATQKEGLSWRVTDILATNSVLLTKKSDTLAEMFRGYVELPTYESAAEARDLAIRLLNEPSWRRDLSAASQQMIDDKCRFEHKFKLIQEATGVKLLGEREGRLIEFDELAVIRHIPLQEPSNIDAPIVHPDPFPRSQGIFARFKRLMSK